MKKNKAAFCWNVGGSKEAKLDYEIGTALAKKYDLEEHYVIVPSEKSANIFHNKKNCSIAPNFFNKIPNLKKDIKYFENALPNGVTLKLLQFSDIALRRMHEDDAFKIICSYLNFWENYLKENSNINFFITYTTAGIIGRSAFCIAKKHNLPYLTIGTVLKRGMILDVDEKYINSKLIKTYDRTKKQKLNLENQKKVQRYVSSFTKQGKMLYKPNNPVSNIERRFNTLINLIRYKENCPWISSKNHLKNYFKTSLKYFFGKYMIGYDNIKDKEKYVFFPLHVALDMQVLVRSPFYFNQAELIKSIMLSLPSDTYLYVKEHPANIGNTPLKQIKEISTLDRVRLLDPSINSHSLIKNSEAVITMASSTGWEAFLYKKPVITFGNAFYSLSDLVYKINGLDELPKAINHALNDKDTYQNELWGKFVYSVLKASFEEDPIVYRYGDDKLNKKVAKNIAKEIYDIYLATN
jgi:capsule polysaccharide modification protein KpsS